MIEQSSVIRPLSRGTSCQYASRKQTPSLYMKLYLKLVFLIKLMLRDGSDETSHCHAAIGLSLFYSWRVAHSTHSVKMTYFHLVARRVVMHQSKFVTLPERRTTNRMDQFENRLSEEVRLYRHLYDTALKQHKQVKQQTDLLLSLLHPERQRYFQSLFIKAHYFITNKQRKGKTIHLKVL